MSYPSKSIGEGWLQRQHRGPMHRTAVHEKIARGQYIADAQVPWLLVWPINCVEAWNAYIARICPGFGPGVFWARGGRAELPSCRASLRCRYPRRFTPQYLGAAPTDTAWPSPRAFKAPLNARAARNCASQSKLCRAKMLGLVCAITFRTARIFWSFPWRMSRDKSLGAMRSRTLV